MNRFDEAEQFRDAAREIVADESLDPDEARAALESLLSAASKARLPGFAKHSMAIVILDSIDNRLAKMRARRGFRTQRTIRRLKTRHSACPSCLRQFPSDETLDHWDDLEAEGYV